MPAATSEAEQYFANLWQENRPKWLAGAVTPAAMQAGLTVPVDFCLTTVARLVEQPQAPVETVEALKAELRLAAPNHFIYPTEAIHISLLGCTARYPSPDPFTGPRIELIQSVCQETLKSYRNVKMTLKGLGIIGNQVFIQVLPHNRQWAEMRQELEEALVEIGETPITFPNKAPIHMNILRVTGADPTGLLKLLNVVERLHETELGEFNVSVIDFMSTDFVLSPANVTFIHRFVL